MELRFLSTFKLILKTKVFDLNIKMFVVTCISLLMIEHLTNLIFLLIELVSV